MRTNFLLSLAAILISGLWSLQAAEPRAKDQVNISKPTTDDLYLVGEKVSVSATVTGDVVAAAGNIRINDSIKGDALVAGGDILINGFVTDDIRAFGGNLNIHQGCGDDLLVFGGSVTLHRGARVMGDLLVFGGEVEINGNIDGAVKIFGGSVILNADVGKDASLKGGQLYLNGTIRGKAILVAEHIELGPDAKLQKSVRYWTEAGEMDFGNAAADARYDARLAKEYESRGWTGFGFFGFVLYSLLASLLLAILLIFGFGKHFSKGAVKFRNDFIKSFGFGVLYVIGIPVLIFFLMITVIGIPLGLLSLSLYIFTLVFAPTFAAVVLAYWLNVRYHKNWSKWLMVLVAGGIFLILAMLIMIPFIGWLIGVVLIGAAFGGIILGAIHKKPRPAL